MKTAPIAFFAYRRPEHTLRSLESLAQNEEAAQSELFIFCDGAKRPEDEDAVRQVRQVVRQKQWCGAVEIIERDRNWGLANSIIDGVTELCDRYGRVIVLEDDLVLSPFFLNFMNRSLNLYEAESQVMQISGFMFPVKIAAQTDAVFLPFPTSWGWATWQRAWKYFDPMMSGYSELKDNQELKYKFNLNNCYPYFEMLESQMRGEIDSWAIRWYLSVFFLDGLTLYPTRSFVGNTGFDGSGEHCLPSLNNYAVLNNSKVNSLPTLIEINTDGAMQPVYMYLHNLMQPSFKNQAALSPTKQLVNFIYFLKDRVLGFWKFPHVKDYES